MIPKLSALPAPALAGVVKAKNALGAIAEIKTAPMTVPP